MELILCIRSLCYGLSMICTYVYANPVASPNFITCSGYISCILAFHMCVQKHGEED